MGRLFKFALITVSLFILTVAVLVGSLPSILSSSWGQELVLNSVNTRISGRIELKLLNISWLGSQNVENLTLLGTSGEEILKLDSLRTDQSLWSILRSGFVSTPAELKGLSANIIQYPSGITNIQRALLPKESSTPSYGPDHTSSLKLFDVNGSLERHNDETKLHAKLSGKTKQEALDGYFDLEGSVRDARHPNQFSNNELNLSVRIVNFPVDFADHMLTIQSEEFKGLARAIFGKYINLTIEETQKGSTATTYWDIQSPNLNLSFDGLADHHQFALAKPAKAEIKLTPELVTRLTKRKHSETSLSLSEPSNLVVWIHDFVVPWRAAFDPRFTREMSLNVEFDLSEIEFVGSPLPKNFIMNNVHGEAVALKGAESAIVRILGKASQDSQNSAFKFDATIDKPKDFQSLLDSVKKRSKINLEVSDFPVTLIDQFGHTGTFYHDLLGNNFKFSSMLSIENGTGVGNLLLESDKIKADSISFAFTPEKVLLKQPTKIKYILSPSFANSRFFASSPLSLSSDAHLQLSLKTLMASWDLDQTFDIDSDIVAMSQVNLKSDAPFGTFSIENAKLSLKGSSPKNIEAEMYAGLVASKDSGVFWDILSAETQLSATTLIHLSPEGCDLRDIKFDIAGSALKSSFSGNYIDGKLSLSNPASFQFPALPSLLAMTPLSKTSSQVQRADSPGTISLSIAPFATPWSVGDIATLNVSGNLSSELVSLSYGTTPLEVQDLIVPWEINGEENKIKLSFSGKTYSPVLDKSGTFRGKYVIKDWLHSDTLTFDNATVKIRASLVDFSSGFLNLIAGSTDPEILVGEIINAEIDAQMHLGEESADMDLTLHGDEFDLEAAMTLGKTLSLKDSATPAKLSMTLTPERFQILDRVIHQDTENLFVLRHPTDLQCSISSLMLPWKSDLPYWHSGIKGDFSIGKMVAYDKKRGYEVLFQKFNGKIESANLSKSITMSIATVPDLEGQHVGVLDADVIIDQAFTEDGAINFDALSISLSAKARQLHTAAFCRVFCPFPTMSQKFEALLGDPIDVDMQTRIVKMDGPIEANLKGSIGKAHLKGRFDRGTLKLDEPFVAEVVATPKLGQYILHDVAPLLSTLESASHPIKVVVEANGFSFPVSNFDKTQIQIVRCTISAGEMLFANHGQIKSVFGLLGGNGRDTLPIWVTPLYVDMHDGKINLKRVDMLILNRYPIASWGTVDIAKEKVNMIIGITGTALKSAMKLEDLDPNYMLQIPFKGSLNNPKIDKKKALAKITSLAASQKGVKGAVIGTVLDIASGGLKEGKVPPPTTQPLPWDKSNVGDNEYK